MQFSFDTEGALLIKAENDMECHVLRNWMKNGDQKITLQIPIGETAEVEEHDYNAA